MMIASIEGQSAGAFTTGILRPARFSPRCLAATALTNAALPHTVEATVAFNGLSYALVSRSSTNFRYVFFASRAFLPKAPRINAVFSHAGVVLWPMSLRELDHGYCSGLVTIPALTGLRCMERESSRAYASASTRIAWYLPWNRWPARFRLTLKDVVYAPLMCLMICARLPDGVSSSR